MIRVSPNLNAAHQLQRTTKTIATSLERLSTGKRVQSPKDDQAAYRMDVRLESQVRGLRQGLANINQTQALLMSAGAALSSQIDLVNRMRELAIQASSGALSEDERITIDSALKSLLEEYKRITSSTEFNGKKLLDGTFGHQGLQIGSSRESGNNQIFLDLPDTSTDQAFSTLKGTGTYQVAKSGSFIYNLGQSELYDVNNDGNLDLIENGYDWDGLSVYFTVNLGDGTGSFTESARFTTATTSFQVADVNNDGFDDLLGYSGTTLYVYTGKGDGSFNSAQTSNMSYSSRAITVADFNNDGKIDVASLSPTSQKITILTGNGDGTFVKTSTFTAASFDIGNYQLINSADFNEDGNQDLVYIDNFNARVTLLLGLGDGSFATPTSFSTSAGGFAFSVGVFDLNNDGHPDLQIGGNNALTTFINSGNGTFGSVTTNFAGNSIIQELRFADFDGDGVLDYLYDDGGTNLKTMKGNGSGSFTQALCGQIASNYVYSAVGDLNGDGVVDLLGLYDTGSSIAMDILTDRTTTQDGSALLNLRSSDTAETSLDILNSTLENLIRSQASLGAIHSRLETAASANLLLADNLQEAKDNSQEVDYTFEIAELVRNQILQQAQVAVLAQSNLNLQVVLSLFEQRN